tara:strand:+ start:16355 stop:17092 length:738 start_codon:yes stop_codon:yes gene_type:complete
MTDTTSLGDRMKAYEKIPSHKLMKRTPVILRLDGKAFHTYTKGMDKPFDKDLNVVRSNVLASLCENIQGALFGYSQSDELSIVLKDWDTFTTNSWFDSKVQKLCSVSASMCTAYWDRESGFLDSIRTEGSDKFSDKMALFDSRCFNVPKEEVLNYLIWRQQDWERNSVQMIAQSLYSHKELQNKSCKRLITLIENEHGIVWGQLPSWQKRGEFWLKGEGLIDCPRFQENRNDLENILYKTYDEKR